MLELLIGFGLEVDIFVRFDEMTDILQIFEGFGVIDGVVDGGEQGDQVVVEADPLSSFRGVEEDGPDVCVV